MNSIHSKETTGKVAKRYAWIATIVYLILFPFLCMLALASFLVFDSPSISTGLGLIFIFGHWCVPLSIPISLYKAWSQHADGNYKKCRQYCLMPLYIFTVLTIFIIMVNTIRQALA